MEKSETMEELNEIFKYQNNLEIVGLTKELVAFYVKELYLKKRKNIIILTNSLYEANNFYSLLKEITENVTFFPMDDFLTSEALAISPELKMNRIETINKLRTNKNIIVNNLILYLKYLTNIETKDKYNLNLKKNEEINRTKLIELLEDLKYKKDTLVTSTGE